MLLQDLFISAFKRYKFNSKIKAAKPERFNLSGMKDIAKMLNDKKNYEKLVGGVTAIKVGIRIMDGSGIQITNICLIIKWSTIQMVLWIPGF